MLDSNTAHTHGAGIYCRLSSNPNITRCVISNNKTLTGCGGKGGGVSAFDSNPQVINCTISGNNAESLAGAVYIENGPSSTVSNCIVEGTDSLPAIYISASPTVSISYNDLHNNLVGNFAGALPTGIGELVSVNANGDSCDSYMNIFCNPLFVNLGAGDFHLQTGSPCIDAGDPAAPLDPDSTVSDIGRYFFDQSGSTPLVLTLTPHNPPIQVPANGGSFSLTAEIVNSTTDPINFDAWTEAVLPGGSTYGPIILRTNLVIPAGATIMRELTQSVPGTAPPGNYTYVGKAGNHPSTVIDSDEFSFEKLAGDNGGCIHQGWDFYGWPVRNTELVTSSGSTEISSFTLSPNPFNNKTDISFYLPEGRNISLVVYDINGREITRLAEGWLNLGMHKFSFDGADLPSGVYFACYTSKSSTHTRKLLLIK